MSNMYQPAHRSSRFLSVAFIAIFAWGMLVCRFAAATDIVSPAKVNATSDPYVALNQDGDGETIPPYAWDIIANGSTFRVRDDTAGTFPLIIEAAAPGSTFVV